MNIRNKFKALKDNWIVIIFSLTTLAITALILLISFPFQQSSDLIFLLGYMTLACTFFPLPTPQIIMEYGGRFDPVLVAVIGAIGTCIAGLIDYTIIEYVLKFEYIDKLTHTKIYKYSSWFFNKIAFLSLVLAGFTPIPFEPFRFLACAAKYNRLKYILSIFLGRAPRYYLLARLQRMINIPSKILIGSIILILLIGLLRVVLKRIKNNRVSISDTADKS